MLRDHGVEAWAVHHSACLVLSGLLAVAALGFAIHRSQAFADEEQAQLEAMKPVSKQAPPAKLTWDSRFQLLGCYPLMYGDQVDLPKLRDLTCMQKSKPPCRSGLPFYRLAFKTEGGHKAEVSWRICAAYCVFKGFDISGVVNSVECRCGATGANSGIFHTAEEVKDREDLLWQPPYNKVSSNSSQCAILATRYLGELPIVGLSFDRKNEDITYVRSIVRGKEVKTAEVDVSPASAGQTNTTKRVVLNEVVGTPQQAWLQSVSASRPGAPPPRILQLGAAPQVRQVLHPCYPAGQCSSGLTWPIRTDFKRTGIPFAFHNSTDEVAVNTFRSVIKDLRAMTCISFNEVSPFYKQTYKILVRGDKTGCFTNFLGWPGKGYRQDIEINLGWCKTELEKGNIIHELCHALGMGHEQTRPDRDAYVQINWATLKTDTDRKQYEVNPNAYVGSTQAGPSKYDFESIMHYPLTDTMKTKPYNGVTGRGAHDSQIGQRQQLSTGDVYQLRSMYRCDADAIECVDDDQGLQQYGPFEGPSGSPVTCEEMAANNLCTGQFGQDVRYFCPQACKSCPEMPAVPEVEGCQDVPGMEDVCAVYADFCPGKVPGYEQWMTHRCRRTCYIEQFCGTSTTIRGSTTYGARSAAPVVPPDAQHVAVELDFSIIGGGYDLNDKQQLASFAQNMEARASSEFGTTAKVDIDAVAANKAKSTVKLDCGCAPSLRLPCSKTCVDLRAEVTSWAVHKDILNQAFKNGGLSGVEVTSLAMVSEEGRIAELIKSKEALNLACILGGIAASCTLILLAYYAWIHVEHDHSQDAAGRENSYSEMSEIDAEK